MTCTSCTRSIAGSQAVVCPLNHSFHKSCIERSHIKDHCHICFKQFEAMKEAQPISLKERALELAPAAIAVGATAVAVATTGVLQVTAAVVAATVTGELVWTAIGEAVG